MNIEREIERFYNAQIDKYKPAIIEELCKFFGNKYRPFIEERIKNYKVFYSVKREDLERCLTIDELEDEEKKLIEYFLDKFDYLDKLDNDLHKTLKKALALDALDDELRNQIKDVLHELETDKSVINNNLCIGKYGEINEKDIKDIFKKNLESKSWSSLHAFIQRISVYNGTFNNGVDYINGLLRFIGYQNNLGKFIDPSKAFNLNVEIPNFEYRTYSEILNYISLMILKGLKEQDIHDFLTNKHLDKINYELFDNPLFNKFMEYFGDLLPTFVFEPNKVIELLGKENFTEFALFIAGEDLEIDIDDVLERMFEERIKHGTYTKTVIEVPFILKTLKSMRAKEEQERLEESKMHSISLILKYLEKYGNAKVYFPTYNSNVNLMISFAFDNDGRLQVSQNHVIFDKPYFNGKNTFKDSKLKENIHILDYSEKDYPILIGQILHSSLYNRILVETDRRKQETLGDITHLYQLTSSMLNLDTNDFIMWVKISDDGETNLLINKGLKNLEKDNPDDKVMSLELKINTFLKKLSEVKTYWDNMQNAKSEGEYQNACKAWNELSIIRR